MNLIGTMKVPLREYWFMNFEKFIKEITNNNWKVYGVENEFAN